MKKNTEKNRRNMAPESKSGPDADTYSKVTEGNTVAWSYERAVEVDAEEAKEAGVKPAEAPEKLPPAPRPPGARSARKDQ